MKEIKNGPYLWLHTDNDQFARRWMISAQYMEGGKPRNYRSDDPEGVMIAAYSERISDMAGRDYKRVEGPRGTVFGWDVGYDRPFFLTAWMAAAFAKHLAKIERRLEKLGNQFGHPTGFPDYVLRVAQAIKVKGFLLETSHSASGILTDSEWRILTPIQAREYLEEDAIRQFQLAFPDATEAEVAA